MFTRTLLIFAFVLSLPTAGRAERVEITLVDELDGELSGYCLDISGPQQDADITGGLQAHTCYSYQGALGVDQVFETDRLAEGVLYMPEFDVCAAVSGFSADAAIGLGACDDSIPQNIALTAEGKLTPAQAPGMCLTAGTQTRRGRGGTSPHQIKTLTLQPCSKDLAAYQTWRVRSADD